MVVDNLIREEARQRVQHLTNNSNSNNTAGSGLHPGGTEGIGWNNHYPSNSFIDPRNNGMDSGGGGGGGVLEEMTSPYYSTLHKPEAEQYPQYHPPVSDHDSSYAQRQPTSNGNGLAQESLLQLAQQQQLQQGFSELQLSASAAPSGSQQQLPYPPYTPVQNHSTTSPTMTTALGGDTWTAEFARNEWRQHGFGMTQALEDLRYHRHNNNINNNNGCTSTATGSPTPSNTSTTPAGLVVRVIAAQPRLDLAQKEYTAYVLRVWVSTDDRLAPPLPPNCSNPNYNNNNLQTINQYNYSNTAGTRELVVEHRYSDFSKLYALLQRHDVRVPVPFPGRSLAGRLGPWSPAQIWAPQSYDSLIQYRLKQLDIWLVHVVNLCFYPTAAAPPLPPRPGNLLTQPRREPSVVSTTTTTTTSVPGVPADVQTAVYQFLTKPAPLPCHQDWTAEDSASTSSRDTTSPRQSSPDDEVVPFSPPPTQQRQPLPPKSPSLTASISSIAWWKTHNPLSFSLTSAIRQACWTVETMCHPSKPSRASSSNQSPAGATWQDSDQSIPVDLLRASQGLLFLTVAKAGLVVSGRLGSGLLIRRLAPEPHSSHRNDKEGEQQTTSQDDGSASVWSAPIAVGTMGLGWGALAGGDVVCSSFALFGLFLLTSHAMAPR